MHNVIGYKNDEKTEKSISVRKYVNTILKHSIDNIKFKKKYFKTFEQYRNPIVFVKVQLRSY